MSTRSENDVPPPSVVAAMRGRTAHPAGSNAERAYPLLWAGDDVEAVSAQLSATRALLTASTPQEVVAVVGTLVRDLGGGLVPARLAQSDTTLPIDLSFGLSEPMLAWADPISVASMRLAQQLPAFVADARTVFDRLQGDARRVEEAERDPLTGLLTRRAWMRRLSEARAGDAVCVLDLDHFKAVNDSAGHAAGDEVLRAIGSVLLRTFRPTDACGRYGGDELVCLAPGMPAEAMVDRLDRLRSSWLQEQPSVGAGVGLSIGVAHVGDRAPRLALKAADRALYRVKGSGRNATAVASREDYRAADER